MAVSNEGPLENGRCTRVELAREDETEEGEKNGDENAADSNDDPSGGYSTMSTGSENVK